MNKIFARLTALNYNDQPIEFITGQTTGGSINIDGTSAVRRTCQLSLTPSSSVLEDNWAYNTKFQLELSEDGEKWNSQGVFIITNFSYSESPNSKTVSITGKDKMCRLNGEIGGQLAVPVDFGTEEIENADGSITINKIPLRKIITNAVRKYADERVENIVINDLPDYGYELWDWISSDPLYMFIDSKKKSIIQITTDSSIVVKIDNTPSTLADFSGKFYSFNTFDSGYNSDATLLSSPYKNSYIAKIERNQTAGYYITDLIYAGDLILKAGETVTALLDKLVTMLGEYEYFYDTKGRFIFQLKKNYKQEVYSPLDGTIMPFTAVSKYSYEFADDSLFTSKNFTPAVTNVKNDFVVWGQTAGGVDIHARCAVQSKPMQSKLPKEMLSTTYKYKTKKVDVTFSQNTNLDWYMDYKIQSDGIEGTIPVDYREVIYGLAYHDLAQGSGYYKTGYEQYYEDILGFWRDLYDPFPEVEDEYYSRNDENNPCWSKLIHTDPGSFKFWFELLDTQGDLSAYNIEKIGLRSKVETDSSIKSIYYVETPEVYFSLPGKEAPKEIVSFQVQEDLVYSSFLTSTQGYSAIDKINDLINIYALSTDSASLIILPNYDLKVNTLIKLADKGEYELTGISFSLGTTTTMTLTCKKIGRYII